MIPTADQLFKYASKKYDSTNSYPTFREAAKRFSCKISDIEAACSDGSRLGYLGAIVAHQTGIGIYVIDNVGDYLVEAYE